MNKAVLVVSFGTSYKETRDKTIGACEKKIHDCLSDYDFYHAYTSDKIIEKIKIKDGIHIDTPKQSLENLYKKGYQEVIVQSLHILCGEEYQELSEVVRQYKSKFQKIVLGKPLLVDHENYDEVVEAIENQLPDLRENEALVFMGHGTMNQSNEQYSKIESMIRSHGINAYVATLEGDLKLEQVIENLHCQNIRGVHLMPLMLVAGYHAVKDMTGDKKDSWKNVLEGEGFEVKVHLQGLGENIKIQEIFVKRALKCLESLNIIN